MIIYLCKSFCVVIHEALISRSSHGLVGWEKTNMYMWNSLSILNYLFFMWTIAIRYALQEAYVTLKYNSLVLCLSYNAHNDSLILINSLIIWLHYYANWLYM